MKNRNKLLPTAVSSIYLNFKLEDRLNGGTTSGRILPLPGRIFLHLTRLILIGILAVCSPRLQADDDASPPPEIVGGQSTPTVRLIVWHGVGLGGNAGYLYITSKQIRFEVVWPEKHKVDGSFVWPANQIAKVETVDFGTSGLHVTLKNGKHHTFIQLNSVDPNNYNYVQPTNLALALQDFNGALAAARTQPTPNTASTAPSEGASTSSDAASSDATSPDMSKSGVYVEGAKSAFLGKRLRVKFFNECGAGDADFQLLQETVANDLFVPGGFASSSTSTPELILNLKLIQLSGIDAATDSLDIFGLSNNVSRTVAKFVLTDPVGKVVRSGTIVANLDDADDDVDTAFRSDAIKKLAASLASYLTQ
jgi:hypothetical protein